MVGAIRADRAYIGVLVQAAPDRSGWDLPAPADRDPLETAVDRCLDVGQGLRADRHGRPKGWLSPPDGFRADRLGPADESSDILWIFSLVLWSKCFHLLFGQLFIAA